MPNQRAQLPLRKRLLQGLGFLISGVLLVWLLRAFDVREVLAHFRKARYVFLLPVVVLTLLNFSLRALRWGSLFAEKRPRWRALFSTMMIGYFANSLLPARAGELARAYLLAKQQNMPQSTVLTTVVLERVLDLLIVFVLLAAILPYYTLPGSPERLLILVSIGCVAALGMLLFAIWGRRLIHVAERCLTFLGDTFKVKLERIGEGVLAGMAAIRNWRLATLFGGYSIVIWLLELGGVWCIARAFNIPLPLFDCLFLMMMIGLGAMIPSSPGNIGTFESAAVIALKILGFEGAESLSFAIFLHVVSLVGMNLIGAVCLALSGPEIARELTSGRRCPTPVAETAVLGGTE